MRRSRLRQGFDAAAQLRARRSFSGGGRPGHDRRRDMTPHSRDTNTPECCIIRRPRKTEGAGNAGCRCTRAPRVHELRKEKHTSRPQVQPNTRRHSLRDGSRLIRDLLGVPCSLAAVASRNVSQGLIPASGDRDHTISSSAATTLVMRRRRVHRPPHHVS
jgi:hypothetical protein